ncbi:MAG: Tryptophan synthase alpha chain [Labilithrix sp.]|nr:Tryptophan synthase alpha chain [Labilithrix sp.]
MAGISVGLMAACTVPDFQGDVIGGKGTPSSTKSDAVECSGSAALTPEDPAKFPKCACETGGQARCVPKEKVPGNVASQLDSCTEGSAGVCVPDPLVKSGGAAPPTCQSAFGEGRCMSLCVPEVAKNGKLLNRGEGDICAEDERCVPCKNPLKGGESTGVCEIGKPPAAECQSTPSKSSPGGGAPVACPYSGPPLVDVTTFPSCGDGARCVPSTLVPPASASLLKTCATGLCAPEKSIAAGGQYLPKTCKSVANAEGRCLNVNIPEVDKQKASLPQDVCDPNERCTPCFSPLDGKETGACKSVSCDAPKQPATKFKDCCIDDGVARGKCVPKAMVPASQQNKLDDEDENCQEGAELCAPNENLDPSFKAPPCTADNFFQGQYSGVCISDCVKLSFIENLGTSRGNCQNGFTCAPCERNGQPTGAPGCPGT